MKFEPIDPPIQAAEDTRISLGNRERIAPNGEGWARQLSFGELLWVPLDRGGSDLAAGFVSAGGLEAVVRE